MPTGGPICTWRPTRPQRILYRNNRDGTFTDVAVPSGAAFNDQGNPQAGMGAAIGDVNGGRPARSAEDPLRRRHPGAVPQPRQGPLRGRRDDSGAWRTDAPRRMGRRVCRIWTTTASRTCSTSPGTSIPRSNRCFRSIRYRGPRVVFRNLGQRTLRRRHSLRAARVRRRRTRVGARRSAISTTTATLTSS